MLQKTEEVSFDIKGIKKDLANIILTGQFYGVPTPAVSLSHLSYITVEELAKRLKVRTVNVDYHVDTLSGGNRQKVLIARGMFAQARILIFVEPTLGVDVGARSEIYFGALYMLSE